MQIKILNFVSFNLPILRAKRVFFMSNSRIKPLRSLVVQEELTFQ
jgi:hypothetical protein